ncbi:MAG: rhomboid family intramembrane serine protease [Clostridiales bacterium]|nr:rhomboid family intramembrane serine protease [Clostridiales bacterium]
MEYFDRCGQSGGRKRTGAWVTGALIGINVVVLFAFGFLGSSEDAGFMLAHGAMYGPLVMEEHEYYRLFTAMFLHFGIEHLVNNMLVLFVLGDNLERALGHAKYLVLYLLCGAGANVVSMLVNFYDASLAVSAGASGAVFGVAGGLLYVVVRNRGRLEDLSTRQIVVMIAFSLYLGFVGSGVDNVAHVAGLVIGIVLAAVLYRKS